MTFINSQMSGKSKFGQRDLHRKLLLAKTLIYKIKIQQFHRSLPLQPIKILWGHISSCRDHHSTNITLQSAAALRCLWPSSQTGRILYRKSDYHVWKLKLMSFRCIIEFTYLSRRSDEHWKESKRRGQKPTKFCKFVTTQFNSRSS